MRHLPGLSFLTVLGARGLLAARRWFGIIGILLCTASAYPATWFVNAAVTPPGGPGTSWGTAFSYLQDALEAAADNPGPDEIWVAQGTYYPPDGLTPQPPDPRDASFALTFGVSIYGGFLTGDSLRTQRDPQENVTILSGDLDHNGVPSDGDSHNIVTAFDFSVGGFLDGFRIQLGSTGMRISGDEASPIVQRCTIFNNKAGGVAVDNGGGFPIPKPRFVNCSFVGNHSFSRGGGTNLGPATQAFLFNCVFNGNSADDSGGGLALGSGTTGATLRNCTFTQNTCGFISAGIDGSGVACPGGPGGNVVLHNSILWHNGPGPSGGFTEQDQIDVACLNILSSS